MYRAFLYFAFLAFCSAAPYGDWSSVSSLPNRQDQQLVQPPMDIIRSGQRDETDLVDTLGAGYEFFKRQPIVSRPLAQQRLAISEQQVPISSQDDTSNHWSDYTKSSAFKRQPVPLPTRLINNDLLVSGAYGQQQQQPLVRDFGSSYGQQQKDLQTVILPSKPVVHDYDDSYDQQQQDLNMVMPQQQSVIRDFGGSYGQQRVLPPIVPQQQPSLMRDFSSSYSQQQKDLPTIIPQQQSVIRDFGN
jgi:hypothetical protein